MIVSIFQSERLTVAAVRVGEENNGITDYVGIASRRTSDPFSSGLGIAIALLNTKRKEGNYWMRITSHMPDMKTIRIILDTPQVMELIQSRAELERALILRKTRGWKRGISCAELRQKFAERYLQWMLDHGMDYFEQTGPSKSRRND